MIVRHAIVPLGISLDKLNRDYVRSILIMIAIAYIPVTIIISNCNHSE